MSVALKVGAAAAAAAYLSAKSSLGYDLMLLKGVLTGGGRMMWRQKVSNRINLFWILEYYATSPKTANKPLLLFEGKTFTYAQVYENALRYGNWLKTAYAIKPKDIVALNFPNSEQFIFIWWGLWSIGARPAFINYNLTSKPLSHCISVATTKLCLVDSELANNITDQVRQDTPGTKYVIFTPQVAAEAAAYPNIRGPDSLLDNNGYEDMAVLIYTSGTTGLPKPAIVSWGKCIVAGSVSEAILNRGPNDIFYTCMPLYHSAASLLGFITTLQAGSTLALGRKFSTKTFWKEVRETKATGIQYVGETLRYLLAAEPEYDPVTGECLDKAHHVQSAFGNGLRPDIWNKFKTRFGIDTIAEFYAATEGSLGVWNVSNNDHGAGAIGRSGWLLKTLVGGRLSVVEVDWETEKPLRDPKTGFCTVVGPKQPGELLFKLPADDLEKRFQGYYNNREATMSKVMRDVFVKGDAWFRTGDMISGNDGLMYFNDRLGDTFRWKSENVSTTEVSEAVGRHPSVQEANVYGVELPHHDGRAGCVAISFDKTPGSDTLKSLATHVRASLPKYAVPLFLRVIPEMGVSQVTGTNKQQKHHLRKAGVEPGALDDGAELFWLNNDTYAPFGDKEWKQLQGGSVKL